MANSLLPILPDVTARIGIQQVLNANLRAALNSAAQYCSRVSSEVRRCQ
jgi:hypothetical protein